MPDQTRQDQFKSFVNGWLVEVAFGTYDRDDLPKLAEMLTGELKQIFLDMVNDCKDSITPLGTLTKWIEEL